VLPRSAAELRCSPPANQFCHEGNPKVTRQVRAFWIWFGTEWTLWHSELCPICQRSVPHKAASAPAVASGVSAFANSPCSSAGRDSPWHRQQRNLKSKTPQHEAARFVSLIHLNSILLLMNIRTIQMVLKRNLPKIWTFPCVFPQKLMFVPTQNSKNSGFCRPVLRDFRSSDLDRGGTGTCLLGRSWRRAYHGLTHGDLGIPHSVPLNPRVNEEMFMKWL